MYQDSSSTGLSCCSKGGALLQILASRLAAKVRRSLPHNSLIVGTTGAGAELSERVAYELRLPYQDIYIRPVYPPPEYNGNDIDIVGAVSGCTDVTYLDEKAISKTDASDGRLLNHLQKVKLECIQEAVSKGITLSSKNWNDASVLLIYCAHASPAIIEAAVRVAKLKSAKKISLVVPFLSTELKISLKDRIDSFIALKEFQKNSSIVRYSDDLSHLDAPAINAMLEQS